MIVRICLWILSRYYPHIHISYGPGNSYEIPEAMTLALSDKAFKNHRRFIRALVRGEKR